MKRAQLRKLEHQLRKGKFYFIIVHGVIGWGITTALLFCLFQQFTGVEQTFRTVTTALIMFPLSGILFGLFSWLFIKRQYDKEMAFRRIN